MTDIQQKYKLKADKIRKESLLLLEKYPQINDMVIATIRERAATYMTALRKEYYSEMEAAKETEKKKVFACMGNEAEFLAVHEAANNSTNRLKYAKVALKMGAGEDARRAIALSAYNHADARTLEYVIENSSDIVSDPILSFINPSKGVTDTTFELLNFNLPSSLNV